MNLSIESSGPRETVKHAIAAQGAGARLEFPNAQPLVQAVIDEIARRIRNAPGSAFKVSAAVVIDIEVLNLTDAEKNEAAVFINGERVTKEAFDRMLLEAQKQNANSAPAPLIGSARANGSIGLTDLGD